MKKEYRICKKVRTNKYGNKVTCYYFIEYKKYYFFKFFSKWKPITQEVCYMDNWHKTPLDFESEDAAEKFIKNKLQKGIKTQTTEIIKVKNIKI